MTLRCDDVARELSASADESVRRADIAGHLSGCSRCSAWVRSVSRQDAAWNLTRTSAPTDASFDALWTRVVSSPAPVTPLVRPAARVPYRALAAAATVLLGLGLGWRLWVGPIQSFQGPGPTPSIAVAPPAPAALIEVEPGKTLIIQIAGDGGMTMDYHIPSGTSDTVTVAAEFEILNFMEAQGFDAL